MGMIKIGSIIVIFISLILKLLNMFYIYSTSRSENDEKLEGETFSLIEPIASYEQFEKVSKETLVQNSPVRGQGDFMDFFIDNISLTDGSIENRILKMNYGEE